MFEISFRRNPSLSSSCLTHVVQDGFGSSLSVLLIVLAETFGLSYTQVGLLKGLRASAQAVLELCSGWFAERVGDARLLIIGLCILGVGFCVLSLASNLIMIAICFLVIGAGTALHHAPSCALIANNCEPHKRSGALGIYNASGDVGKLLFTGLFSLGIGVGITWQQISISFGLVALFSALAVYLLTNASLSQQMQRKNQKDFAHATSQAKGWGILNWRSFNVLLVVTSIDTAVQTVAIIFTPFLMLEKGLPISIAAGAAVILLAGGVPGKAGCGFLAQKIGTFQAFLLIQVLTAVGLVGVIVAPVWLSLILLFPLGGVLQGSSSITYGYAANLIEPEKMARGYALLYAPGTFASVVGPIAFGWYADMQGISYATYLMALFVLFSIPPMMVLRNRTKTTAERVEE